MSQITKIEMWKDTGFQEGAIEVPSVNDNLPELETSTDNYIKLTYDGGIRTSTADFFSGFTIPEVFADYISYSYLRVTYEYNNTDDPMVFYGWVDDIALRSDTDDNPSIYVSWHIDYWRTYLNSAKFGYGLVQSRPASDNDPPQSCSYRYRLGGDYRELIPNAPGTDVNWLIFTYVKEEGTTTTIRACTVPIDKNDLNAVYKVTSHDTTVDTPSLAQVISGEFLTKMGISASQISSAFISPIPPFAIKSKSGTTYELQTSITGTTTEYIPSDLTDTLMKRTISSAFHIESRGSREDPVYELKVGYSDGTSETRTFEISQQGLSSIKAWIDTLNGFVSGENTVSTSYRKYNLRELMEVTRSQTEFQDGDYVVLRNVGTTAQTSGAIASGKYTYSVVIGAQEDRTYTYNGSWPDVYIYSYGTVSGLFYSKRESAQVSVGVEYPDDDIEGALGYAYTNSQSYYCYDIDLGGAKTTDTSELIIVDMNGTPVANCPWGLSLGKGTVRVITSSVSAYIEYRFDSAEYSHSDGLAFAIPLQPVDLASNSWVDYVYSGQREYDISQRKIASQQALVGTITSSLTGGASNAIMASIGQERASMPTRSQWENLAGAIRGRYKSEDTMGAVTGGDVKGMFLAHTPAGSFTGAKGMHPMTAGVASIGVGVATSVAEYAITQYFNGKLQKAEDMLQAKQFDAITVSGSGWDWLWNGCRPGIISLVADDYSLNRFDTDKRLNGIYCSEPTEDCDFIRTSEGPYQVSELVVTGAIPVQARAHIKGRMANGVRIKTINTQNVTEGE